MAGRSHMEKSAELAGFSDRMSPKLRGAGSHFDSGLFSIRFRGFARSKRLELAQASDATREFPYAIALPKTGRDYACSQPPVRAITGHVNAKEFCDEHGRPEGCNRCQ